TGAGRLHVVGERATYLVSQRADHMWEGLSSATTRSRPIINTRDEPHADPERYRRLHVIVGDSTMSQTTTLMRTGTTDLVLRMLEAGTRVPDLALANPVQAIRDVSRDQTGRRAVPLAAGGTITALGMQHTLLELAARHAQGAGIADVSPHREVLELWERTLHAVETGDLSLVDTEIEWVMKKKLLDGYAAKHGLAPHDERLQQLDLAWHDVHPTRGLMPILQRSGAARTLVDDARIRRAMEEPPRTRAKLRGDFVRAAQEHRRDFSVDWVHLKLNDEAQRTVVCKDPFADVDQRVDDLVAHIRAGR
ncbi:MAG: Pup--protein ligase, partial [Acidobacteria bacterium]